MAVTPWAAPTQISGREQNSLWRTFVSKSGHVGIEGKEKLGYCIGTSSAVRLNSQMETENSLKLKAGGGSVMGSFGRGVGGSSHAVWCWLG